MINDNTNSDHCILILESNHNPNESPIDIFTENNITVDLAYSLQQTLDTLGETEYDVLIIKPSDALPSWSDIIDQIRRTSPKTEIIVILPEGAVMEMASISQI